MKRGALSVRYTLRMPQQEEIVWHVLTHEHKDHSIDWYWALGLATVVGAATSIFFGNLLLGVILLIGGVSIGVLNIRGPREHQVKLDARGATLDGTMYPWKSVDAFWIHADAENPRLYLTTHSLLMPRIVIPLDSTDHSEQVRTLCLKYAKEAEEEDRKPFLIEHISEIFGL